MYFPGSNVKLFGDDISLFSIVNNTEKILEDLEKVSVQGNQ